MKKLVLFVWIIFSFLPLEADILSEQISPGTRDLLAIRVEFLEDNTYLTTGNGKFMTDEWTDHDTTYVLDPLPHDRNYFTSHLTFINNYWDAASNGRININTDNAYLLPSGENAYTLSKAMRYYSDPDSLDYRLAELVYETIMMAVDSGEFISSNDGVIIYHAGAGQDFKIDLDNSPFDIPSFFFDDDYLSEYLPYDKYTALAVNNCTLGVVLPESQNQLSVNIALNGTEILLTGMLLGLPTLYDTEYGRSGAGTFGLMDQGSNNGSGLCPIKPSAFERYFLGAVEPIEVTESANITLLRDEVYKLPISSNEYFLVEFRKNAGMWADSLMWSRDDVEDYLDVLRVFDSLDLVDYTFENGVLTELSDLDMGLPTSGLLIWHIVEPVSFGENPNAEDNWFLNLVEADGGDDIGKWYNTFDPSVNNGWKWDMWFPLNEGYRENNPSAYKTQFTDYTHPNTRSKEGLPTGIAINDFKFYADSVVIQLVMESAMEHYFDGMVFDEMTNAFEDMLPDSKLLVGYKDSSVYLFDGSTSWEVYKHDTSYVKGQTAFLSYNNSLVQITNGETYSDVSFLANTGGLIALSETHNTRILQPIDLENIAIHDDTLFLPTVISEMSGNFQNIFFLDVPSWTMETVSVMKGNYIPYVRNNSLEYVVSQSTATVMNDTMIFAGESGFNYYDFISLDGLMKLPYAEEHRFKEIIPVHLDNDGKFEILALTEFKGETTLSAFSHNGSLFNNYPFFDNYTKIRVFERAGSYGIAAYDPSGKIDIIQSNASIYYSIPAPVNATSFFIEQVTVDTAWIITDGSIIPISSSDVYWGYDGKDAAHSNTVSDYQSTIPMSSNRLIKYSIYNYPNPIEGSRTKFRFFATGATYATINIYSLDGRFITRLGQDVIDQQWNEITWLIDDEESGVYLAKIDITDGTTTESYFVKPAILK